MKIGLLTTSFPRSEADAAGHFVLGFARALAACGHQLEVLAPMPGDAVYQAPLQYPGVDVRWVPYLQPRWLQRTFYGAGVLDNLRRDPRAALGLAPFVLALARETRARMPHWDAVISHWALPCALIAGELKGARTHLAVLHSADVFVLERLPSAVLRRLLATRIARQAQTLLFSSRDLRRRFLALLDPVVRAELAMRAHVCPMGIDAAPAPTVNSKTREQLRSELGFDRFTLLSLGRLIPLKGIEHAIDAVSSLPDVELVVAGYGPAQAALEAHARRSDAPVRFVGPIFGAQKSDYLHAADAFVLPSVILPSGRTEGMPTSLLEAMDHGLPVIATDVGGVSDVVRTGDNGVLIAKASSAQIAHAVRSLLDTQVHRALADGARETAALYHWSVIGPLLDSLLTAAE